MRSLVSELDKRGRQPNALGEPVHAHLARLVLEAVQEARDESITTAISEPLKEKDRKGAVVRRGV